MDGDCIYHPQRPWLRAEGISMEADVNIPFSKLRPADKFAAKWTAVAEDGGEMQGAHPVCKQFTGCEHERARPWPTTVGPAARCVPDVQRSTTHASNVWRKRRLTSPSGDVVIPSWLGPEGW